MQLTSLLTPLRLMQAGCEQQLERNGCMHEKRAEVLALFNRIKIRL